MSLTVFLPRKIKTLKISLTVSIMILKKFSLNNLKHKDALTLFHINTYSLPKNIAEFQYLLNKTKTDFNVIDISESRIKKDKYPTDSINLKGYSYESCTTESASGGTLLYISNHLSYKPRNDLCIYKSTELESTFVEILNPKKINVIVSLSSSTYGLA